MTLSVRSVGIVAIGRNEGERLKACLNSLKLTGCPIIYVDSGSTDGSVELARSFAASIVELDMSIAFSAARARNAGFEKLIEANGSVQYVQFIDGDCTLEPGWLRIAQKFLEDNEDFAVVCGRRRERYLDVSLYNRLIDLEWDTPVGETRSCGGDSMVRISPFKKLGGYDPSCVAGEEPELCYRLRRGKWKIMRIDAEMTLHDSAMTRLSQWWKRSLRSGYGGLYVYWRCTKDSPRPFERIIKSSRRWVVGWPALVLLGFLFGHSLGGRNGFFWGGMMAFSLLPIQVLRLAWKRWRAGLTWTDAFGYSVLIMISKIPEFLGQLRLLRESRRGIEATIIEHKT